MTDEGYVKALEHAYVQSAALHNALWRAWGRVTVNVTDADTASAEGRLAGLREAFATPEKAEPERDTAPGYLDRLAALDARQSDDPDDFRSSWESSVREARPDITREELDGLWDDLPTLGWTPPEPKWEPMCQCGGPKNHCVGPR